MKAESIGLSGSRLARLDKVKKRRHVDTGYRPGLLIMVYRRSKLGYI